jgi:hypothetical protein
MATASEASSSLTEPPVQGVWVCLDLLREALRLSRQHLDGLEAVLSGDDGAEALHCVEALAQCLTDIVETVRGRRAPHGLSATPHTAAITDATQVCKPPAAPPLKPLPDG